MFSITSTPIAKDGNCADAPRPVFEKLKVIHLDLVLMNVTQFFVANLTQIANMPLIALADGAIRIKSSAFASVAANQVPIKQPRPSLFNSVRSTSR